MSLSDFRKKLSKLTDRITAAKDDLENADRTKRQLSINIQHLERLVPNVEAYADYEPQNDEQFNYNAETSDILETAAE